MFPVFPVLFPVCSQLRANGLIVFPAFPVSAARAMRASFRIPFLHAENTGNSENWIPMEELPRRAPVEQTWNDREQMGGVRRAQLAGDLCSRHSAHRARRSGWLCIADLASVCTSTHSPLSVSSAAMQKHTPPTPPRSRSSRSQPRRPGRTNPEPGNRAASGIDAFGNWSFSLALSSKALM